jgi:hypothetical protein
MPDRPPLRNYAHSRAVVMGNWDYAHLPPVLAAGNSLERMVGLLTGPLCGWPEDRMLVLANERGPGDLPDRVITAFEDVTDVALFYFVGHGQIDAEGQLCLGLADSRTEHNRRAATSLPFQAVRRALLDSDAATKIVILDCCFAGLASQPVNTLAGSASDVLDMASGAGAYTMAAWWNPASLARHRGSSCIGCSPGCATICPTTESQSRASEASTPPVTSSSPTTPHHQKPCATRTPSSGS